MHDSHLTYYSLAYIVIQMYLQLPPILKENKTSIQDLDNLNYVPRLAACSRLSKHTHI